MGDNLPNISADQLTRAVAGTLSALDILEENENPSNEQEVSKGQGFEVKTTGVKNGEGWKSSLQLLECLSSSIDPTLSKFQELNEAHMSYTPSTSFFGRARMVSKKKKISTDASAKLQTKKYSSRKNYKLLPPQIPNQIHRGPLPCGPQTVCQSPINNLCQPKKGQGLTEMRSISVPLGNPSLRPILIIQNSQVFQSPTDYHSNSNSSGNSSAVSGSTDSNKISIQPGVPLDSGVAVLTSSNPQALSVSTYIVPPSSTSVGRCPRPSLVTSVPGSSKGVTTQNLIPLQQINSVIQLPVPLTVSSQVGSLDSLQVVNSTPSWSSSSSSPYQGASQKFIPLQNPSSNDEPVTESKMNKFNPPHVFTLQNSVEVSSNQIYVVSETKEITPSTNQNINKVSIQSGSMSDINGKNVETSNQAHALVTSVSTISVHSPSFNVSNSFVHYTHIHGDSSLVIPTPEPKEASHSISQGLKGPKAKFIQIAASQNMQIFPQVSAIGTSGSGSFGSRGPVFILPKQNVQLPVAFTSANQVILSVHPQPLNSSSGSKQFSAGFVTAHTSSGMQESPGRSETSESNHQSHSVISNKNSASHPNIIKLLQTVTPFNTGTISTMTATPENSQIQMLENSCSSSFSQVMVSNYSMSVTSNVGTTSKPAISQTEKDRVKVCTTNTFLETSYSKTMIPSSWSQKLTTASISPVISPTSLPSTSTLNAMESRPNETAIAACASSFIKPATSRLQFTVVASPFSQKHSHQAENSTNLEHSTPTMFQADERSLSSSLSKSSTILLSPPFNSISTLTERNKSQTTNCFTSPISVIVSQKNNKQTDSVNPVDVQSKLPKSQSVLSNLSSNSNISKPSVQPPVTKVQRPPVPVFKCPPSASVKSPIYIPSIKGSKLIISPTAISQLQSLMHKQGRSEGYFVISAKRGVSSGAPMKNMPIKKMCQEQTSTVSHTVKTSDSNEVKESSTPRISPPHVQAMLSQTKSPRLASREKSHLNEQVTTSSNPSKSRMTIMSTSPASQATQMSEKELPESPVFSCDVMHQTDPMSTVNVGSFGGKSPSSLQESNVDSVNKDNEEVTSEKSSDEETDDGHDKHEEDSDSSSDSRSSSVPLVIETNDDSDQKFQSENQISRESSFECNSEESMKTLDEKEAPLNLSKDIDDEFKPRVTKNKMVTSLSSDMVNSVHQRDTEHEGSSQSPPDTSHILDSIRSGNLCIPQSPLSLTEIIRQQQFKIGLGCPPVPSPHFTSKETAVSIHGACEIPDSKEHNTNVSYSSSEMAFSMSESCPSSCSQISHTSDHQIVYEQSLNTPHPFFPNDIIADNHVHDSSDLEAAMNLQRLRECAPPIPPIPRQHVEEMCPPSSTPANVTSPKSPLSISSMHQMEVNSSINPPMTPNTILNLLNRVPTPLLNNHQDLLPTPSSHDQEMNEDQSEVTFHKSNDHQMMDRHFPRQKISNRNIPSKGNLFDDSTSKIIVSNSDVFVHPHNALDQIAENYLPQSKEGMVVSTPDPLRAYTTSNLRENLTIPSKSCQQDMFTNCGNNPPHMSSPSSDYCLRNYPSSISSTSHQHCYHSTSCPVPLTVTINLDSNNDTAPLSVPNTQEATPSSAANYESILQESSNGNFPLSLNNLQEKCGEAEILRHLIQNTNTSCHSQIHQHPQQNQGQLQHEHSHQALGLHFESNTPMFNSQIPESQFDSEMPGSFMHLNQPPVTLPKNHPCSGSLFDVVSMGQNISFALPLPTDSSLETYSTLDNNPLPAAPILRFADQPNFLNVQMNSENELQSNSFNNNSSITVYETNPDPQFEPPPDPSFQSEPDYNSQREPPYHAEQDSTFIMSNSLSDIHSSFENNLDKSNVAMHSRFIDSSEKIHMPRFREDSTQSELFFGDTNPTQTQTQSNDLHLYDMNSMHSSSHGVAYQMTALHGHERQLDTHQGVVQPVHEPNLPPTILSHDHDMQSHKVMPGHHFDFQVQTSQQYPGDTLQATDSATPSFSTPQGDIGFIQEPSFPHFYNGGVETAMPMYTQHCDVGSEAPMLMSSGISNLNCAGVPYSNASDLQFRFNSEEVSNDGEKHPVLPSASFSPPSVADQAVTPDSGNMYNGAFHNNVAVYDMYVREGNTESRSQMDESLVESGNFCVECNMMYKSQCKFHPCDYIYVSDHPILSHARLTLPACLKLAPSSVHGHTTTMGVFAKEKVSARVKFGPLVGSLVSCDKLGSTRSFSLWQTFSSKNVRVIDTSDENSSNWLMFVKPARLSAEQNLVAFQHGSNIYFVTRREVEEGQELLYWFSKDYARMLGITAKPKSAQHQLCPHCHLCKQVFADRKQVRSHIRLQHPKPHVNKCPHCSRRFSQVSHLNAHVTAVHLRLKKFVCNHCGKRFNDSSNLRKHVRSHSEERNFKCQMCGKAFRQKAHLKIHMNTHMPVKHEQCGFCGERFTRAFERKQHELQHTKQHKIECQHCSKVFYKQKIYKEHLKIHSNERNFPCSFCGKAFRNKFALTRHGPSCKQRKRTLSLAPDTATPKPHLPMHTVSATQ